MENFWRGFRSSLERNPLSPWAVVALLIAAAMAVRIALAVGYQGADDRTYISYAWHYLNGGDFRSLQIMDHWVGRIGAWLPLAWSMRLFGASEWVLCLPAFIASFAGMLMLFWAGSRLLDPKHAIWALAFLVLLPLDVTFSGVAYSDLGAGLLLAAAFLLFLAAAGRDSALLYLMAGLCAGAGYLVKETTVIVAVPVALVLLLRRRFDWRSIALMCAGFLVVLLAEAIFWHAVNGDPLYRIHSLLNAREHHFGRPPDFKWYQIPAPRPDEIQRSPNTLVEAVLIWFTNEEWGLFYLILWPVTLLAWRRGEPLVRYLCIFLWSVAALYLFFPFHLPYYTLPRDPRYFVALNYPALLLLAWWLLRQGRWMRAAVSAVLVLSWLPCLLVSHTSSDRSVSRALARYASQNSSERIWMSNRLASDTIILAGFSRDLTLGVNAEGERLPHRLSSPNRSMRPDMPVVGSKAAIPHGLAVIPEKGAGTVPPSWRLVQRLDAHSEPWVASTMGALRQVGVPEFIVRRIEPHQESCLIYRTGRGG